MSAYHLSSESSRHGTWGSSARYHVTEGSEFSLTLLHLLSFPPSPSRSLCSLIRRLGSIPPRASNRAKADHVQLPSQIFIAYIRTLPYALDSPDGLALGKIIFRLLFPHFSPRRRYGLKESLLARSLSRVLGLKGLREWEDHAIGWRPGGLCGERLRAGCLGREIEILLSKRSGRRCASAEVFAGQNKAGCMSIVRVDRLLDELASHSTFSNLKDGEFPGNCCLTFCSETCSRACLFFLSFRRPHPRPTSTRPHPPRPLHPIPPLILLPLGPHSNHPRRLAAAARSFTTGSTTPDDGVTRS